MGRVLWTSTSVVEGNERRPTAGLLGALFLVFGLKMYLDFTENLFLTNSKISQD